MGEEAPLRCSDCLGKFGEITNGSRCGLCSLHWRIGGLLRSDQFPSVGKAIIGPQLKEVYYRALEVADGYRVELAEGLTCKAPPAVPPPSLGGAGLPPGPPKSAPGGKEPTGCKAEDKAKSAKREAPASEKAPLKESPAGTTALPDKRPAESTTEAKAEPEESEYESGEEETVVEESPERNRSSGHRGGEVSPVPEERRQRSPVPEERRGRRDRDPSPRPQNKRRRSGETGESPRRRPEEDRRPRSPIGPPPPREEGARWRGPILAPRGERPPIERRKVEPKYTNKGAKKRKQQAARRRRNLRPPHERGWGKRREKRTREG